MSFEKDGYIFKRQFLSKELCDIGKRIKRKNWVVVDDYYITRDEWPIAPSP